MHYSPELFIKKFDIFESEVDYGMKCIVLNYAINQSALVDSYPLNRLPEFFSFLMYNLMIQSVLCLSRIFDENKDAHDVNKFMKAVGNNINEFSFESIEKRRGRINEGFFNGKTEFNIEMYRSLKKRVNVINQDYKAIYKEYRNKIIAHRGVHKAIELDSDGFTRKDLLEIFIELHNISNELWQRYHNGCGYDKVCFDDISNWVSLDVEIPNGKPFFRLVVEEYKSLYRMLNAL